MLAGPPSSGRFRLEREHVDMNLVRRMFSENLDGALFPGGIAGAYPQQQAAPHNLLVEILRMMLSEPFGEHRTDQSAGTSCERGPGDNREQGSAGGHDGPHRGERPDIYEHSADAAPGNATRFSRSDRTRGVSGKSVSVGVIQGGRRILKKK